MANPNVGEIVATTLKKRSAKITDNVINNSALFWKLNKKGRVKKVDGGQSLVETIDYAENGTFGWYNGYDTLDISPSEVIGEAEYAWKLCSAAVTMSGDEMLKNSGSSRIQDLVAARVKNAETTIVNGMATGIYSDGTGTGGKQLTGLKLAVDADPTSGTYGGIDRATWEFWRNVYSDVTAPTSSTILGLMNAVWLQLVQGTSIKPDIITTDNTYYSVYEAALQANQRFTDPKMAESGFETLKYKSASVVLDGGMGGAHPSSVMFFLNTDFLKLCVHKDRDMVPLDPDRMSINQDATVKLIGWMGNLVCSQARAQGCMYTTAW